MNQKRYVFMIYVIMKVGGVLICGGSGHTCHIVWGMTSISTLALVFRFLRGDLGDFILIPFHLASGCPFDG